MHNKLVAITLFIFIATAFARSVQKGKKNDKNVEEHYNSADFDVIYDQKQNASENYRLDVSGVDVVIAPPSSIIQALLSPLSVLAMLGEFSRKAPFPLMKKNAGGKRVDQTEISSMAVNTIKTDSLSNDEHKISNSMKNLEEKIHVQELLPGFKKEEEIERDALVLSEKPSVTNDSN